MFSNLCRTCVVVSTYYTRAVTTCQLKSNDIFARGGGKKKKKDKTRQKLYIRIAIVMEICFMREQTALLLIDMFPTFTRVRLSIKCFSFSTTDYIDLKSAEIRFRDPLSIARNIVALTKVRALSLLVLIQVQMSLWKNYANYYVYYYKMF